MSLGDESTGTHCSVTIDIDAVKAGLYACFSVLFLNNGVSVRFVRSGRSHAREFTVGSDVASRHNWVEPRGSTIRITSFIALLPNFFAAASWLRFNLEIFQNKLDENIIL